MKRAVLLVNPHAGRGWALRAVRVVREVLLEAGWWPFVVVPPEPRGLTLAARLAAQAGVDAVLLLGGDGSLRWAAAGLRGSATALGVLPLGTANVLARYLGLSRKRPGLVAAVRHSTQRLLQAQAQPWDLFQCNEHWAALWCGWGLDAQVVHRVEASRRGKRATWLTWMRFVFEVLRYLPRWPAQAVRLEPLEDDRAPKALPPARMLVVASLPLYAGGWLRFPQGSPNDGALELWTLPERSLAQLMGILLARAVRNRLPLPWPWAGHILPTAIRIHFDRPWPGHSDGDPLPPAHQVTVRVYPRAFRLLVPG